ncbi:hypothetical protein C7T94_18985 [Pedobacter yulinensis]|uniref:Uncharacterized protein n=1 Tax=Pedobacter yulinensis TaxID=2126353 RepID=A0A2T3HGJ0_9SPHI|nr:hypothetical protein [Pedobacter yulinensis]PST81558.1 hypothetical protein C7T94_18985 [Pedobacter yulinensis]
MKRFKLIFIAIALLLLLSAVLQQCTAINIYSSLGADPAGYVPLRQGARAGSVEMVRITTYSAAINYHPGKRFFLVVANGRVIRLNSSGMQDYALESDSLYVPRFSYFVFDQTGAYDLSEAVPKKKLYKAEVNQNQELSKAAWQAQFDSLYKNAEVVIFGFSVLYGAGDPIMFRVKGEWTRLQTGEAEGRLDHIGEVAGARFDGYPAKYSQMYLLKDQERGTYSDLQATTDGWLQTYYTIDLKEKNLGYPESPPVRVAGYRKTEIMARFAFTDLPLSWRADLACEVNVAGDVLRFRSGGEKPVGPFKGLQNFLAVFSVPAVFAEQTGVHFLRYAFPTNGEDSSNNGLYVIRALPAGQAAGAR